MRQGALQYVKTIWETVIIRELMVQHEKSILIEKELAFFDKNNEFVKKERVTKQLQNRLLQNSYKIRFYYACA